MSSSSALLQKLVPCLVRMLGRTNLELLILVVTFLRKLSVFAESKDQMAACEVCAGTSNPASMLASSVLHGRLHVPPLLDLRGSSLQCQPAGQTKKPTPLLSSFQTLCTSLLSLLPGLDYCLPLAHAVLCPLCGHLELCLCL